MFPAHLYSCAKAAFLTSVFLLSSDTYGAITYSSASFNNFTVLTNDANGFSASADILQGGVVAGTITASVTYGMGTNPFESGSNWGASNEFRAPGQSVNTAETNETAEGDWTFTVTPNAGWSVHGMSLLTSGTTIANPTFANLISNGTATVSDDNQGLANELLDNYDDGDPFTNGDDLVFIDGTANSGITRANHQRLWSYDSAGATSIAFTYEAGVVTNITNEGIAVDLQMIPEPSGLVIICGLAGVMATRKRRRIQVAAA